LAWILKRFGGDGILVNILMSPKNWAWDLETLETIYMGPSDSQIGPCGCHPNNITGWPRDGNHWAWDNGPYLDGNVWADWTAWSALLFLF